MSDMLEVLFTCDSEDQQSSCSAWDFRTGTNLMTYKGGGNLQAHSLCILRSEYIIAANNAKPLLHVWPINGQEQFSSVRFVVPGRVNALALSPDNCYIVAGIQETIYIWHLSTGRMLNTIAKHYQPINCLRFTDDSHFVSAGQDGGVLVWNLSQVVVRGDDNQLPLYSFNDHGLPVTDVHVGVGGIRAYMLTVSLDRSCRIYDLSNGSLLLTVVFAEALKSVTANALETCVYVGSSEGNIYEFHIDSVPRTKEYHMEKEHTNKFQGHKASVNCLTLSLDGQTLISGGEDHQVCIWHIPSRQLLKTMTLKGGVSNLMIRLSNTAIFNPEYKQPHVFAGNLKRMLDPIEMDEDHLIEVLVTEENSTEKVLESRSKWEVHQSVSAITVPSAREDNRNDEIEKLQAEIKKLKNANKQLFQVSVKRLLEKKK